MNNNYGTSNMNASFGGYSSKQNESMRGGYGGAGGSPNR
jgi:hypothetical protein